MAGKILYSDSTPLKENANKRKLEKIEVEVTPKDYLNQLNEAVQKECLNHHKKPLNCRVEKVKTKNIKKSTADPESSYMMWDGKPEAFHYLAHHTVGSKYNIITAVYVPPSNINNAEAYLARLDRQKERFCFQTKYVGLDAAYFTSTLCMGIAERGIQPVIAYRRSSHVKGKYTSIPYTNVVLPNNIIVY